MKLCTQYMEAIRVTYFLGIECEETEYWVLRYWGVMLMKSCV